MVTLFTKMKSEVNLSRQSGVKRKVACIELETLEILKGNWLTESTNINVKVYRMNCKSWTS